MARGTWCVLALLLLREDKRLCEEQSRHQVWFVLLFCFHAPSEAGTQVAASAFPGLQAASVQQLRS